jgi:hypothetical protein
MAVTKCSYIVPLGHVLYIYIYVPLFINKDRLDYCSQGLFPLRFNKMQPPHPSPVLPRATPRHATPPRRAMPIMHSILLSKGKVIKKNRRTRTKLALGLLRLSNASHDCSNFELGALQKKVTHTHTHGIHKIFRRNFPVDSKRNDRCRYKTRNRHRVRLSALAMFRAHPS